MLELLLEVKEYIENVESSYHYGVNNGTDDLKEMYHKVKKAIVEEEQKTTRFKIKCRCGYSVEIDENFDNYGVIGLTGDVCRGVFINCSVCDNEIYID